MSYLAPAGIDPVIRKILSELQELRASDLHVIADSHPKVRIDGRLIDLDGSDHWDEAATEKRLLSLLTPDQREHFKAECELDFSITLDAETRFRVNFYYQRGMMNGAFRVVPRKIKSLDELSAPKVLTTFANLPRGLVLVTGPTGSGKTTTLAAMIAEINHTREAHIMTVEDPIEFIHENDKSAVNQREVGLDTKSFANALKFMLRQDPDVILVGELRDLETVAAALTAAETGHLVLGTLHTQSSPQTIERIIDVFPAAQQEEVRNQLAGTLKGVVSQVLLPNMSGEGRVMASEVLVVTPAVANLIRENKTFQIPTIMMASRDIGMQTLDQDLASHVQARRISVQAAFEVAADRDGLDRLIGKNQLMFMNTNATYGGKSN